MLFLDQTRLFTENPCLECRELKRHGTASQGSEGNYFSRRWRGCVPLPQLLWRDIIGIGTLINLVATMLALAAVTQDAPSGLAVALHFAPLPYNLFLFGALLRTPGRNEFAVGLTLAWLVLMTLV